MSKIAIRASGGCSGYMNSADPEHTTDLGKILIKSKAKSFILKSSGQKYCETIRIFIYYLTLLFSKY